MMVRRKRVPKKTREEPRMDSGAALSDPAVLSGGSAKGELMIPTLRNTNWNYGAAKARYRKTELQLRQPKGFPIKPLKITLERARGEAELEAAAKRYADPDFEIHEDCKEDNYDGEVEPENEGTDSIVVNTPDDFEYSSADDSADESDASAELPASKVISEKPVALIDSLGRTRAATSRRKAQEVSDSTKLPRVSHEDKENVIVDNKKRKRGNRQAAKQPRKTLPKKSV
ncbi:hypothetical protein ACET3X_000841 [Alternaria dauci]|uniref:Uncharacterized protein n=1 Tax=Alternaria dauci TaxID=48095 RepID=A0ABR3UVY2_9PLEO